VSRTRLTSRLGVRRFNPFAARRGLGGSLFGYDYLVEPPYGAPAPAVFSSSGTGASPADPGLVASSKLLGF
jgi:hypothetical protein